jgi:hypothetical protein
VKLHDGVNCESPGLYQQHILLLLLLVVMLVKILSGSTLIFGEEALQFCILTESVTENTLLFNIATRIP